MNTDVALQVEGLSFAYPQGTLALDQVRFQVARGEHVGLVGTDECGKTTLFLCLAGVLSAARGSVLIGGLDPSCPEQRRQCAQARSALSFKTATINFSARLLEYDVAFGPLNLGLPVAEEATRCRGHADGGTDRPGRSPAVPPLRRNGGLPWPAFLRCGLRYCCWTNRRCFSIRGAGGS